MSENTPEPEVCVDDDSLPPKPGMEAEDEVELPPLSDQKKGPVGNTGADKQFQMFMNPMFAELEARVKESEKILDRMNDQFAQERLERKKEQEQGHLPEPLKGRGQNLNEVMRKVEDMIVYEYDEEAEDKAQQEKVAEKKKEKGIYELWTESSNNQGTDNDRPEMHEDITEEAREVIPRKEMEIRKLDEHGTAAVTAHSVGAYVSCLPKEHFNKFAKKIRADCQLWLSKMFRFDEASVYYHEQPEDGLVRVIRLAMYQKYPKYLTDGFEALYSRPPVIYISAAARPGLGEYICQQLGLPQSSICSVPCSSLLGSASKMRPHKHERIDTVMFDKLVDDDIAAAKTPVALVAFAGTPNIGHVDDLEPLQELCKKKNIWMHVEGDNLAMVALLHPPSDVSQARFCDSFTVNVGRWVGVPAIPYATLFKIADPVLVQAASLTMHNPSQKLSCLPLWVVLQSLGIEVITERILAACELADTLYEELIKIKSITQFSRSESKEKDKAIRSFVDLITKTLSAMMVFEMVSPTIVFRYMEHVAETQNIAVAPYAVGTGLDDDDESEEEGKRKLHYYNSLNIWLAETLQTENPNVDITIVELDREGVCIKFSPLESAQVFGTRKDHLSEFIRSLKSQISILDATVLNYEKFRLVTEEQENLRIVEVPDWAGLGAVQYVPAEYLECIEELTEKACTEINHLNAELVHKLKSTDSAFSLGFTESSLGCVKFGLITDDTDVVELITLVQATGKQVEESSKYVESMSELIRKGIEEANKDLVLENQHKLQQEGVLRQLPMVGSLVNWWSPPPKDVMKGRTFNLVSGTIASTEETYRYKMQLQKDGQQISPRSRNTSETTSITSQTSAKTEQVPPSPSTKTAGDVKAGLVNVSQSGDHNEAHAQPGTPNGNLRLEVSSPQSS